MGISPRGSLLIKDKDKYIGIVTEVDFTQKSCGDGLDPKTTKVSEIMSNPILYMYAGETMILADEFMRANKIRHLPIIEQEKIVGIISAKDIMAFYLILCRGMG